MQLVWISCYPCGFAYTFYPKHEENSKVLFYIQSTRETIDRVLTWWKPILSNNNNKTQVKAGQLMCIMYNKSQTLNSNHFSLESKLTIMDREFNVERQFLKKKDQKKRSRNRRDVTFHPLLLASVQSGRETSACEQLTLLTEKLAKLNRTRRSQLPSYRKYFSIYRIDRFYQHDLDRFRKTKTLWEKHFKIELSIAAHLLEIPRHLLILRYYQVFHYFVRLENCQKRIR